MNTVKSKDSKVWAKHIPGVTYQGFSAEREDVGWLAELTLYSSYRQQWRMGRATIKVGSRRKGAFYKTEERAVKALADEMRRLRDELSYALGELEEEDA